jgi:hypothetical protein
MLVGLLLTLWLALLTARGTPVGNFLHRWLVDRPVQRLARIRRGQVLLGIALLSAIVVTIWLLENDGRMLVAMGLPDVLAFATAIDLATLLDFAAVALVAGAAIRVRSVVAWVVQRTVRRPRQRAPRTRRAARPPAANDDDRPAFARAA